MNEPTKLEVQFPSPDEIRWAATILGRKGGLARSPRKTAAVRLNAKLGGWPKGKPRKGTEI